MAVDRSRPAERVAEHQRAGAGVTRVAYPIWIREAAVVRRTWVSERMIRLTLGGPQLENVLTFAADDHVKLIFPDPEGGLRVPVPNDRDMLDWPHPLPITRCYTIRRYDAAARELDLDFVVHDGGLASDWATSVAIGDSVPVAGPPGATVFPHTYDRYVFVVDSTALPAAARWLESAPAGAAVDLVGVVEHAAQREYPLPGSPAVHWFEDAVEPEVVRDLVDSLVAPDASARTLLFAAGEADLIKPLRSWCRQRGVDNTITGYWKRGVADFDD